ncbi:MAG: arsenite methyltransferase [Candidatus Zixiibacteriota bacterium]
MPEKKTITEAVKAKYSSIAKGTTSVCCQPGESCGDGDQLIRVSTGYSEEELATLPDGAEMGLGCGNPVALAEIKAGEVVVDLGSGGGIDCFLASQKVGDRGLVIGVDITEEMIKKARDNARKGGYTNVEFRQGEIEHLPVEASSVDLVISNCVINLAADKDRVFREIYRVLKPGGRMCVSDIVSKGVIPDKEREDMEKWAGCIAGALERSDYLSKIEKAGFNLPEVRASVDYDYGKTDDYSISSITVVAYKPNNGH